MKKRALILLLVTNIMLYAMLLVYSAPLPTPTQPSTKTGTTYLFVVENINVADSSGTTKIVTVSLSYYGKYTLLGSKVSIYPGCNATVLSDQPVLLGSWRPGTLKVATFTVDGANASTICPVSILVSWQDGWDDTYSMNTQMGGSVLLSTQLNACWSTDLRVSLTPQMLYMNTINSAVLEVVNKGSSPIRNVAVAVSGQGVTLLNVSVPLTYNVNQLSSGSKLSIPLQLVPQSSFPSLLVTVSYVDCTGSAKTSTFNVPLYASQGQSILVVPDPATVTAGASNNVTLKVINLGNVLAQSLQVILNLQASPLAITPAVLDVGSLSPEEAKTFKVRVDVPSTATASTPVSYQVLYTTPGSGLTFTQGSFTLFLLQQSSVTITSIEVVPQKAEVGSNVVLALSLINSGTYPVYAVNVSAVPTDGLVSSRTLYTFLGQLNPQVLTSVPFSFKAVKEGSYEVKFRVTYIDAYGKPGYAERSAFVEVVPATQSSSTTTNRPFNTNVLAIALLLAVILVFALYFYKRSRGKGAQG